MPICVSVKADDLFRFILPANQILTGFLRNVSAAELVVAYPDNSVLTTLELDLLNRIWDMKPITNLVAVMPIDNDIIPHYDWVAASIQNEVRLKLGILITAKRPYQCFELSVNTELSISLVHHPVSSVRFASVSA